MVVVLGVRILNLEGAPGFLGMGGVLIADINLVFEVVLVLGLTVGAGLARAGKIEAHRRNQTTWVLVNAALVALIMVSSLQDARIQSSDDLAKPYYWITWLHAFVGVLAVLAGLFLVVQMNGLIPPRRHLKGWKTLMRMTLAGYWVVVLLGFATYYFWYVSAQP